MGRKKKSETNTSTKKKKKEKLDEELLDEDDDLDYDYGFTHEMTEERKAKERELRLIEGYDEEDEDEDVFEDNLAENVDSSSYSNDEDTEDFSNSLQIAGDIHKLSDIYKQFPQLPKEVQYAYFDNKDKNMVRWNSKLYHQFKHYIQKVLFIADKEVIKEQNNNKDFFNLQTKEDIRTYFKNSNKQYLYYNLMNLEKEEQEGAFEVILETIKNTRDKDIIDLMYGNDTTDIVFNDYNKEFGDSNSVDPFGLMNSILTINETSKGYKGNMIKTMRTTIQETKNIDMLKEGEDDSPEEAQGFGAKVKNAFSRKKREDTYD